MCHYFRESEHNFNLFSLVASNFVGEVGLIDSFLGEVGLSKGSLGEVGLLTKHPGISVSLSEKCL